MNKLLYAAAFTIGLGAIGWVGAGYVHANPLALSITLLIGAFYLMGALELQRFHRDSVALQHALTALSEAPTDLGGWLGGLPAAPSRPWLNGKNTVASPSSRVAMRMSLSLMAKCTTAPRRKLNSILLWG